MTQYTAIIIHDGESLCYMAPYTEVEVKFIVADREAFLALLEAHGAQLIEDRFEHNIWFDTPEDELERADKVFRLRRIEAGDDTRHLVTVKTPLYEPETHMHHNIRSRHEAEFMIDDARAFTQALDFLGYVVSWRYDKYRKVYRTDAVEITLDDTPLGTIIEIEGEAQDIEQTAASLGLDMGEGIALSYAELFERVVTFMNLDVINMTYDAFKGIEVSSAVLKEVAHDQT